MSEFTISPRTRIKTKTRFNKKIYVYIMGTILIGLLSSETFLLIQNLILFSDLFITILYGLLIGLTIVVGLRVFLRFYRLYRYDRRMVNINSISNKHQIRMSRRVKTLSEMYILSVIFVLVSVFFFELYTEFIYYPIGVWPANLTIIFILVGMILIGIILGYLWRDDLRFSINLYTYFFIIIILILNISILIAFIEPFWVNFIFAPLLLMVLFSE